jgi:Rrf2 family protein
MSDRFSPGSCSKGFSRFRPGHPCRAGGSRILFPPRRRGAAALPERRGCSPANQERRSLLKEKYMFIIKDDDNIIFFVDLRIILLDYGVMLCLSQTTGYAVRALICLDQRRDRACLIRDVAHCAGIPKPYLARIINDLTYKGLVTAKRGYQGGITLARPARDISLLQVVEAIEGTDWIAPCLLGLNDCTDHKTCPTHVFWQGVCKQLKDIMGRTTLADVMVPPSRKSASRRSGARRVSA